MELEIFVSKVLVCPPKWVDICPETPCPYIIYRVHSKLIDTCTRLAIGCEFLLSEREREAEREREREREREIGIFQKFKKKAFLCVDI
jgi:hypothetical protein